MRAHLFRRITVCAAVAVAVVLTGSPAFADSIRDRQWHLTALGLTAAHRVTEGAGVTVAVIDTGVNAEHPDLAGNVLPGVDLTPDGGTGWTDTDGHGTAVAGLIAAHGHGTGHKQGALGVAPRAKILPIRTSPGKIGDSVNTAKGIQLAVERGAKVITISAVTGTFSALSQAVQNAVAHDVVVVAAVGNRPDDVAIGYPARYPGVLAVGATGRDGKIAKVSVTGPEIAITAPGVDIVTTDSPGGYQIGTGTSDSTAIMAGAAALTRAAFPDATAAQIIQKLTATANDKGRPGHDDQYGYGTVDLPSALTASDVPAGTSPIPPASAAAPAPATMPPAIEASGPLFRFNTAFYVAIATVILVLAIGAGLAIWLTTRRRRP